MHNPDHEPLEGDGIRKPVKSVLQDWVMGLGLRHQGVLLTAIRGCDTVSKDDPIKLISRCLRAEILHCHNGDPKKAISFIEAVDNETLGNRMVNVLKNYDHYPHHYVMHLMHASEIIGYKKPREKPFPHNQNTWLWFYRNFCKGLHLNPETEEQLDERLNADEDTFKQKAAIE